LFCFNLSDGSTLSIDLAQDADQERWSALRSDPKFQEDIRGVSIQGDARTLTLPVPFRFRTIHFDIGFSKAQGKSGTKMERAYCYADSIRIVLTSYTEGGMRLSKVEVSRVGKMRHGPLMSPNRRRDGLGGREGDETG